MTKRFFVRLAVFLVFGFAVALSAGAPAATALSRLGSQGEEVRLIQEALIEKGYLEQGGDDGIFGTATLKALKCFQSDNGLEDDGIAGKKTLKALGVSESPKESGSMSRELKLLARVISAEARGEPYDGQVAVGAVVLNRTRHPSFPDTVAGVIYQRGAFDTVADGQIDMEPTDSAYRAARDALDGADPTGGCVYFYDPRYTSNSYMLSLETALVIGNHVFCEG